jgi:adenylate cyclase
MASDQVKRKLAAILAADIAGYSRLMGMDEPGTLARLKEYRRELIDPKNKQYRGRVVKTTGDGILIEFPSVVDAISCSIEVQQGMRERNADFPAEKRIEFRIGINLGDVIIEGRDLYGDGVNIAARLEGLAEPGGICISQTVLNHARGKIAFEVEDLGEHALKNIAQPIHVYRLLINSSRGHTVPPVFGTGAGSAGQAFDCRAAVPEHERRSRTGVLCRWDRGGHHHGAVPLP